jgi:hypothetical protein
VNIIHTTNTYFGRVYLNHIWFLSILRGFEPPLTILTPHPPSIFVPIPSAGFTYRLDRLKPRASTFRGPPAKVYTIFNTYWTYEGLKWLMGVQNLSL